MIGDGAAPHVVAAVAGVPVGELGPARDALLAAGLLARRRALRPRPDRGRDRRATSPRTERERLHREAARALMAADADAGIVASHLLECGPQADPEVSGLLLRAAAAAARRGAPRAAAAYLERALRSARRATTAGACSPGSATVAFDAGLPDSRRRLREALREVATARAASTC